MRLDGDVLSAEAVTENEWDLPRVTQACEVTAWHYRVSRTWSESERPDAADVVRAVVNAVLEVPDLFSCPLPPLDELMHDPLDARHEDEWRDRAAWSQQHTVSFAVTGMPEALHMELERRARTYGMTFDQYTIAVLGHLARRTPFAEDMEPWDGWAPPRDSPLSEPIPLRAKDPGLDLGDVDDE